MLIKMRKPKRTIVKKAGNYRKIATGKINKLGFGGRRAILLVFLFYYIKYTM